MQIVELPQENTAVATHRDQMLIVGCKLEVCDNLRVTAYVGKTLASVQIPHIDTLVRAGGG